MYDRTVSDPFNSARTFSFNIKEQILELLKSKKNKWLQLVWRCPGARLFKNYCNKCAL